jgi:hypothetical protein
LLPVDVDASKTPAEILNNCIIQEVKAKFGIDIEQKEILAVKNKETGKDFSKHNALGKQTKFYNGSFCILTLANPEKFKNNRFGKELLTIYDLDDKKSVKVDFSVVRHLKFSAVYEKYLKGKSKNVCLKVMDLLIKGEDSLMMLAKLFGNAASGVVRLVGRIVG